MLYRIRLRVSASLLSKVVSDCRLTCMVGITHIRTVKMCALQCNECFSLSIRLFFLPLVFLLGELLARLNVLTKILPTNLCKSRGLEFF